MTDPIKSIVEETLAAAAKATEGSLRSECSFAASEYVEKGPWFSNQKVQKHESFMAGAKWMLERLKPNNAEKLALIVRTLVQDLTSIKNISHEPKIVNLAEASLIDAERIAKGEE